MSLDLLKLKNEIMELIKDDEYDLNDLKIFLGSMTKFTENTAFINNITLVTNELTKDRDGDNTFTIQDIKLLTNDIASITILVNGVLLAINALPDIKIKYNKGVTEELIFKIFVYIFLVIIPKQTGKRWEETEKEHVVDSLLLTYQLIISSQIIYDIANEVVSWFKDGNCKCVCSNVNDKQDVFDDRIVKINYDLNNNIQKNKNITKMDSDIQILKKDIKKLKNNKQ